LTHEEEIEEAMEKVRKTDNYSNKTFNTSLCTNYKHGVREKRWKERNEQHRTVA
jgi:hypothetical protein